MGEIPLLVPDQIGFGARQAAVGLQAPDVCGFLNEFLRQLKDGEGKPGGGIVAGGSQRLRGGIGGGGHLIPVEKLVLVDRGGVEAGQAIPDLNPSSLAAMRGMMEAVFYDTSGQ